MSEKFEDQFGEAGRRLLARLNTLRENWAMQAWGIERTHSDEEPAAKALRSCIGDLLGAIKAEEF